MNREQVLCRGHHCPCSSWTRASFWGSHIRITNMLNPQYQLTSFTLMGFQLHLHTATADAQPADRQRSTSATALNMARVQTHYPLPPHIRTKVYMHSKICNNIDLRMRETTCLSSWQNVSETHSFITRRTVMPMKIRPSHLRPSISWDHLPHFKNNNSFSS